MTINMTETTESTTTHTGEDKPVCQRCYRDIFTKTYTCCGAKVCLECHNVRSVCPECHTPQLVPKLNGCIHCHMKRVAMIFLECCQATICYKCFVQKKHSLRNEDCPNCKVLILWEDDGSDIVRNDTMWANGGTSWV